MQSQLEGDCNALKENEQRIEHLAGVVLKCVQQTSAAQKHQLNNLKEIHDSFKKQYLIIIFSIYSLVSFV